MKVVTEESASSCLGGDMVLPPGFRFHPTDEELVLYYLKRKICGRSLKLDIIAETDVYKWDPEDLPGQSKLRTGDRQWFFFSPRDRKYPNGGRSNRATMHGYWKATGKDRTITCNSRSVGIKKTLVFYEGRAPSGQRTDWVMHEYTLDEEELKRCRNAYDYYALYKVYKKSGLGPKNGEQYGAPFKEEEWADDECLDVNGLFQLENPVQELNHVVPLDSNLVIGQQEPLLNNLITDNTVPVPVRPLACGYPVREEETQSSLFEYSSREVNFPVHGIVAKPSFELAHSGTYALQQYEASEVTSAPTISVGEPQPQVAGDDFLEDFLEMDDLLGPGPNVQNFEKPVENLQFDQFDALCEFDLYHDSAMFFNQMGPGGSGKISQPYMNNLENEMENPLLFLNNIDSQEINYQLEPHSDDASQVTCERWTPDQKYGVVPQAEATDRTIIPPLSGVVFDDNSAILNSGSNQNKESKEDDGTDSWFTSALWSFVESIPTTPASASENSALVNRAFERMSSFSRGRVRNTTDAAGSNSTPTLRRSGKASSGILCFSVLGVLFALLWVFIGTSVEILGRYISS